MANQGYTDIPARKDEFNIKRYVEGLTDFVQTCSTPITMAIQGDWGTGKTSIMSMIRDNLENTNNEIVWFNTWQFSQFNMGDKLPLLMMSKIVDSVCDKKKIDYKQTADRLITTVGNIFLGSVSNGTANMDSLKSAESIVNVVDEIDSLRKTFQDMVNEKVKNGGRVIFFIDDLDRLNPGKAVELLEVLKVFLDCENCVFVLAIDYGVVSRGVKEKYGDDFSEEKGKSFFDKIIQVPFKMPVADYDISAYVKNSFQEMGIPVEDERLMESYESLITQSIGNNPRAMKRLFNAYLLLAKIASKELFEDVHNRETLFALLCMQSKYEDIYNYLIKNKESISGDELIGMKENVSGEIEKLIGSDEEDKEAFMIFMTKFMDVLDRDGQNGVDEDEMNAFKTVLSFSAITSNNATVTETSDNEYRWRHREKVNKILNALKQEPDFEKLNLTEWYTKTREKGSWWGYAKSYLHTKDGLEYGCEFRLDPVGTGEDLKSAMTVNIYHNGGRKKSIESVLDEIGKNPLSFLNVDPEIEDHNYRISYKNVVVFDTKSDAKDQEMIELLKMVYRKYQE